MKLIAQQDFSWAHRGVEVKHYQAGAEIETDDEDLIEVSTAEGWAAVVGGEEPATDKDDLPEPAGNEDPAPAAGEEPAPAKRSRGKQ